jgi:hypothetical protein
VFADELNDTAVRLLACCLADSFADRPEINKAAAEAAAHLRRVADYLHNHGQSWATPDPAAVADAMLLLAAHTAADKGKPKR